MSDGIAHDNNNNKNMNRVIDVFFLNIKRW